ncbi:MAG: hypothetical protein KDK23_08980 [Leptospiraceae bacterium]|nr:hypothetical protein [Leptospiraceae bacterium]
MRGLPLKAVLVWLALASLAYVLLLGEAGYFHRKDLESRLAMLRQEIEELETENRLLRENYYLMRQGEQKKEKQKDQKAIILKFDREEPRSEPETELHITGLNQIRVLYWFGTLFGALLVLSLAFAYQRNLMRRNPESSPEIELQDGSGTENRNEGT